MLDIIPVGMCLVATIGVRLRVDSRRQYALGDILHQVLPHGGAQLYEEPSVPRLRPSMLEERETLRHFAYCSRSTAVDELDLMPSHVMFRFFRSYDQSGLYYEEKRYQES